MSGSTHTRKAKPKKTKAKKPSTKRISISSVIIRTVLILTIIVVTVATILKVSEFLVLNRKTEFPKLEVSLADAPIEQINSGDKSTKYLNNTTTFTINGTTSTFNNVELKGRGNFTWSQIKKPYQIKLPTKESIFDLDEAKKWILLANYYDPSHLRNDTAFCLEDILGDQYALSGDFLEVYFDDIYNGLYYLSEKVEISKSRIDLSGPSDFIVELDNLYGSSDACYYDINNNCFALRDIHSSEDSDTAMTTFIDKINSAEQAISSRNYGFLETLIDIDSFTRYFLLSEFSNNPDAYSSSLFMYLKDDKIYAGPGWDFDLAFGNKKWPTTTNRAQLIFSPIETMPLKQFLDLSLKNDESSTRHTASISTFFFDLMDIPEFSKRVKEIYQETLSGHKDELLNHIKSQADYIRPAALRDQERWKIKTDFDEEVDYLIDWVAKRYDHFEETYGVSSNEPDPENAEVTKSNKTESTPDPAPESEQPSSE